METADILTKVKSLSRVRRVSSYHRVDLHVHSPVSSDYCGNPTVSSYDFVSAFVARGFDLIAITDHNTGAYIDQAIEARNQIAAKEGKNITVIPGVELHVSPGVHLLAVLPEGGSAGVSDLLSRLGLPIEKHGDTAELISRPVDEISKIVRERGGLLIGAHSNSTKGVVQELKGQSRLEWLRTLDALEINSGSEGDKVSSTMDYVINSLKVSIPFTFGSDSHDCASDTTGMWVKMADASFTSLRQLVFEPLLRVSRVEPVPPTHGRIVGFTTTQGIYANEQFRFSPHLNVLLGGRGAGKSAAIDLLRFAVEAGPQSGDVNEEVFANRIKGFLQSVGEVLVVVVGADAQTYVITRSGTYENRRSRSIEFKEPARVYQVVGDDLIQRDMRPLEVLGIEFYGQGEAARLANRVDEQLRLIDENLDLSVPTASISEAEEHLASGEDQLIDHKRRLEELHIEAATRPRLEERRDNLAKSLADPIFAERSRWDRERDWVQGQQDWVQAILESLPESIPTRTVGPIDIEESSAKAVLKKVQELSDRILEGRQTELDRFRSTLADAMSDLQGYQSEWNAAFKIAENQYLARLAELGAGDLEQIAAELRSVEQSLARIDTTVDPEIERIESEITSLENHRTVLIAKLKDARAKIAQSRLDFVDELNSRLDGDVLVELSGSDRSLYFDAIDIPLQRSGMQRREDQVSLVCESFTPEKFVEIVRTHSVGQLTGIGITPHSASLIISVLNDEVLYKIERVDIPPVPSIRIKREGESAFTDLSLLSVGEKCSAILSIALLSKGKPLVIDQPEDDLDHAFIINSIVQGIRAAKSGRQIIAATHNPNIPVLGDAEMVYRVARRGGKDICYILNSGGLEIPQVTIEVQGLEGGAEAFERRRRRYSGVPLAPIHRKDECGGVLKG